MWRYLDDLEIGIATQTIWKNNQKLVINYWIWLSLQPMTHCIQIRQLVSKFPGVRQIAKTSHRVHKTCPFLNMNFTKITALLKNVVKIIPATKSRTAVAALTLPAFADVVYDFFQIQPSPDTKRNFKTHLLELSVQGEEQLQEFMKALHVCIADVSHQYR